MNDGHINASMDINNASLDVTFGEVYEIDKGMPAAIIANLYSSQSTYSPGDYVIYRNKLYKCLVAIETPEEFDTEKWELVKVAEELKEKADAADTTAALALKADKTYVNTELNKKADKSSTYTKTEVDIALASKAAADSVYTKVETNNLVKNSNLVITEEFSDHKSYPNGSIVIYEGELYVYWGPHFEGPFDPEAWTKYTVDELVQREDYVLRGLINNKMDKSNPTGTGALSINRKANTTVGEESTAFGYNSTASGEQSIAGGYNSTASNTVSVALGNAANASGFAATAFGTSTKATGNYSQAEGYQTRAGGGSSHAEGNQSYASGGVSHAEGYSTQASGQYSHVEGNSSVAEGSTSHAEGYSTTASGDYSHAEGRETVASAHSSHAEGLHTQATDNYSHSEGCRTIASGNTSHAEGYGTTASGNTSHAEGEYTTASGTYSHAEGNSTTANGYSTHAEGDSTIASGDTSHAEGLNTTASGNYSHSEGLKTTANHKSQHVFGEYNIEDNSENEQYDRGNYVEIVGNGYWDSEEEEAVYSNARTLDWNGNETLAGNLTFNGSTSLTSEISRLDGRIDNLPVPMVFKGTLGVNGTISSLPSAGASNEGYTYKVITDGTYASQSARAGDVFTSNGSEWVLIPAGDTDTDTWRAIKVNGVEKLGNGISSGAVDFEDTANVKFEFDANGNKVRAKLDGIYTESEVDELLEDKADADNTYTKEQVDDIVYNILPDDTASGAVANFNTSLALPIKSLEVDVNAVQASGTPTPATPLLISGWSDISVVKCGANLWDEVWELGTINNQTGQNVDDSGMYRSKNYIQVPQGENLYLVNGNSDTLGLRFYDSNKNFISARAFLTSKVMTYGTNDLPAGTTYIRFVNTSTNVYLNNIAINYPSSDNAYHAYNGNTEVINLGGTYYGGHLTQDKDGHRQFEVTCAKQTADLSNITPTTANGYDSWLITLNERSGNAGSSTNKKCSVCGTYRYEGSSAGNEHFYIGSNAFVLYLNENTYRSGTVEFSYPLATPYVIDLPDGEPIITLAGVNNFFADTGNTSVVFKDSVNGYVEKKIANVQALILNG